jgi:hypothetical protein
MHTLADPDSIPATLVMRPLFDDASLRSSDTAPFRIPPRIEPAQRLMHDILTGVSCSRISLCCALHPEIEAIDTPLGPWVTSCTRARISCHGPVRHSDMWATQVGVKREILPRAGPYLTNARIALRTMTSHYDRTMTRVMQAAESTLYPSRGARRDRIAFRTMANIIRAVESALSIVRRAQSDVSTIRAASSRPSRISPAQSIAVSGHARRRIPDYDITSLDSSF